MVSFQKLVIPVPIWNSMPADPRTSERRGFRFAGYIAVVFFSQALWRCRSVFKSISTLSASLAVNRQSAGSAWPQTPQNLWRRL